MQRPRANAHRVNRPRPVSHRRAKRTPLRRHVQHRHLELRIRIRPGQLPDHSQRLPILLPPLARLDRRHWRISRRAKLNARHTKSIGRPALSLHRTALILTHARFYRNHRMSERVVTSYKVLVGLEIHVQLATRTKMFTSAPNGATNFGAPPNSLVDEVVLGLPGTLPVMNKRAVEYSIMVGLALGCKIARHTKWDRKSYYYPDLPKNYQISQYDLPLCNEGMFEGVRIRRAHLEEDAGKLLHDAPGGFKIDHSIVDLNRAGTPLLEIVTEPDLHDPKRVAAFAQELQKVVQFLGVSEGQMQMGHMRFEPNINVHITDGDGAVHKTAITEIKNLNSFSVLERATAFEIQRQIQNWIDTGSLGRKSTYGWDEAREMT